MLKRRVFICFAAVACILIIGELFARYGLGLGEPPISIPDEHIDYLFAPNQVCHRFGNVLRYNNKSMRCDFDVVEPCEGGVLVIGDSVINGGALTDHEKLATTILQRKYKNIPFYNVSAGSWGPGNYAAYLRKYGTFGSEYLVSAH